ncbi:MAG: hypothetical protein OXB93_03430 [Cytophagales bacterium]|nr:hypothetical protein [Cytophagales bacterium]
MIKAFGNLLGGGLLRQAGKLIDRFVTTSAERTELKQAFKQLVYTHRETMLKHLNEDRDSARKLQEKALQQEDRFSKRFIYYLASLWSISGVAYIFLVTFTEVVNERVSDTIMGFLMGTIISTIVNYFYGSAIPEKGLRSTHLIKEALKKYDKSHENEDNKNNSASSRGEED